MLGGEIAFLFVEPYRSYVDQNTNTEINGSNYKGKGHHCPYAMKIRISNRGGNQKYLHFKEELQHTKSGLRLRNSS